MMRNWAKLENKNGFPYYCTPIAGTIQWDHPKFSDIKQAIDDCNYVIYATYRMAMKIRTLQRCLHMEDVSLNLLADVLSKHRLGSNENTLILESYDFEAILNDLFYFANKTNHTNIDVDFATEMVLNFIYNIFDNNREGKTDVISMKVTLALLCSSSLLKLHEFMFALCVDHNNCITRVRLHRLLTKIHCIMVYLHEDVVFDLGCLKSAIEICFFNCPGFVGITENNFMNFLNTDVDFLNWLPLIMKLRLAETAINSIKCSTCKTKPILGLYYRCTKCTRYLQCQRCFLTGRLSHSHKLSHNLKEYYNNLDRAVFKAGSLESITLCGLLCQRKSRKYSILKPNKHFPSENNKGYRSTGACYVIPPLSAPEFQLQAVIRQLESQNRELQQTLIFGKHTNKEMRYYLEEYRYSMSDNIEKLKMLKIQISDSIAHNQNIQNALAKNVSTPASTDDGQFKIGKTTSPITVLTDSFEDFRKDLPTTTQPKHPTKRMEPVKLMHNDLDEALAKLQEILEQNFSLNDSPNDLHNTHLKFAVNEVEDMLTSIIDNVESNRCESALPIRLQY